jgi:glycyl-tRNA synthetase alpha subunit
VLDSRGVISVTERATLIGRVRQIACRIARAYLAQHALASAPPQAKPAEVNA